MIAALLLAAALAAEAPPQGWLEWVSASEDGREGEVRFAPLPLSDGARLGAALADPAACARLLRVVALPDARADEGALPPLWGDCRVEGDALYFRPRHALAPGISLVAGLDSAELARLGGEPRAAVASLRHDIPAASAAIATVVAVSPSGEEVPANLLRVYVEFSHPMSAIGVERQVRLIDARGRKIADAFVETKGGLWDAERRRLTLFVHPGRQKRGVALGETLGPTLIEGEWVRLVVDRGALDADGRPLAAPFERVWRVGAPQRAALDPESWRVAAPAAPEAPLELETDVALDRALARRTTAVVDAAGAEVAGRLELSPGERRLRFIPTASWRAFERYELRLGAALEDASGNRIGRAFERLAGTPAVAREARLPFVPRFVAAPPAAPTAASAPRMARADEREALLRLPPVANNSEQ